MESPKVLAEVLHESEEKKVLMCGVDHFSG